MTATSLLVTQRPGRTGRSARPRLPWAHPTVYFVALIVVGLMLAPIAYIVIGGFRTNAQITTDPSGLPQPWVFSNYLDVITGGIFWRQVLNSTIVAVATTAGVVTLGLMAAYVLARYRFAGRGVLYAFFAAGLMFPLTVAITPLYIVRICDSGPPCT